MVWAGISGMLVLTQAKEGLSSRTAELGSKREASGRNTKSPFFTSFHVSLPPVGVARIYCESSDIKRCGFKASLSTSKDPAKKISHRSAQLFGF